MTFTFDVRGPPQGWHTATPIRDRRTGKLRFVSPPAMKAYAERMAWECLRAIPAGWPRTAKSYRCDIDIRQRKAKPDRSDVLKLVEDVLTRAGVWIDDCRVDDGYARRVRSPRIEERVEVTVEVLA